MCIIRDNQFIVAYVYIYIYMWYRELTLLVLYTLPKVKHHRVNRWLLTTTLLLRALRSCLVPLRNGKEVREVPQRRGVLRKLHHGQNKQLYKV